MLDENQEDKFILEKDKNTEWYAPGWEPRGQVGSIQDATEGLYTTVEPVITHTRENP